MGKQLPPLQSHAFKWVCDWVRVIVALDYAIDKVEKPSLASIRHLTNHIPIIISSLSFFSLLFLHFERINNLAVATPSLCSSKRIIHV